MHNSLFMLLTILFFSSMSVLSINHLYSSIKFHKQIEYIVEETLNDVKGITLKPEQIKLINSKIKCEKWINENIIPIITKNNQASKIVDFFKYEIVNERHGYNIVRCKLTTSLTMSESDFFKIIDKIESEQSPTSSLESLKVSSSEESNSILIQSLDILYQEII